MPDNSDLPDLVRSEQEKTDFFIFRISQVFDPQFASIRDSISELKLEFSKELSGHVRIEKFEELQARVHKSELTAAEAKGAASVRGALFGGGMALVVSVVSLLIQGAFAG